MSKGTKQIRAGRVISMITVLESKVDTYKRLEGMFEAQGNKYGVQDMQSRLSELEGVLAMLREAIC